MQEIKDEAIADGTFMKAPNGNPTNLTEKQWLHVRTKAFKEWFGDWENDLNNASKVVDENGEPLVVYHSGNSGITAFSRDFDKTGIGKQFWGKGFYFGTIKSKDEWARRYKEKTNKEATQYATFLNLKNPKIGALSKVDTNFDGAILPSQKTTEGTTEPIYIAINPNQVKSATDNIGSYSRENDNIYYRKIENYYVDKLRY
jgi:hypothetical protein